MIKKKVGKYTLYSKNEGTWVKWSVVNKNNIVRFVGLYKDAVKFAKK